MKSRMRRVKLAVPTKMDELQIKELPIYLRQFSVFPCIHIFSHGTGLLLIHSPLYLCSSFLSFFIPDPEFSYCCPMFLLFIYFSRCLSWAFASLFQAGRQVGLLEVIQCLCCHSVLLDTGFSRENTVSVLGFGKRADNGSMWFCLIRQRLVFYGLMHPMLFPPLQKFL